MFNVFDAFSTKLSRFCSLWHGYAACAPNLTQGEANLAQLAMTAQFYRQDAVAVAAPNLTHLGLNLAQSRTTQQ